MVVSDNGPQYISQEFHEFSVSWEFNHVTWSPHHPKENGKAESSVKVVKPAVIQDNTVMIKTFG